MNISYLNFLRGFLRDKISLIIFSFSFIILGCTYFVFYHQKSYLFFPDPVNIKVDFYNDSIDNGKSIITENNLTTSSASMTFILKDGFMRPYVGMGFESKTHKKYDLSGYNMIKVDVSGKGFKPMFVYLVLKDSIANIEGNILGFRYLCQYIEVSEESRQFRLPLKKFSIPDWWFDKYNLSPAEIKEPNWSHLMRLTLATGLAPSQNTEKSFQVNSIVFYRDNTKVVLVLICLQLLIVISEILFYYFRKGPKNLSKFLTIDYRAVIPEKRIKSQNSYLDYINENFNNSELNLNIVSRISGISERRIAEGISSHFNCNFKSYINHIRIKEAQRLLKESELNISEIAYKVGFSSPSHFNRVFKNLTGKNPSEYLHNSEF
jgi:AraC-like DNA-binding protein